MFYNLDFHVSNYRAMKHPQTNVSKEGIVPTKAQGKKIAPYVPVVFSLAID
jgi:hypothetical protein